MNHGHDGDARRHPEVEDALARLLDRAEHPRALAVAPADRLALRRAVERAAAQLLGEADTVLTIALAGCTGSGKSTLINALSGAPIAEATEIRPTTMRTRVYHHRDVPAGGLPPELAAQAAHVAHDRPELRQKVLVDTPDLDTFATENRAATKALLKAAGLVLYVFSPEKYWEERAWSVIREEQRFSAALAVLNKADTVPPEELERIAEEVRRRFAELGKPDITLLKVQAARHIPRNEGRYATAAEPTAIDEFPTLRAYIEHEIRDGDIARMVRQQRLRVLDHLATQADRLAPADLAARLDALEAGAEDHAAAAADRLALELADRLDAAEADLRPSATLRYHQRFFGPFRAWLAAGDLIAFGLPRLVRRLRFGGGGSGTDAPSDTESILATGRVEAADDLVRSEARKLQDGLYAAGLPVARWAELNAEPAGARVLADAARELESRFEAMAAAGSGRHALVARVASSVGLAVPMVLSIYGLYALLVRLASGQVGGGLSMLELVAVLTILSYIILHGLVSLGRGPTASGGRGLGPIALREALRRTLRDRAVQYREELEADLADLHDSVATLRACLPDLTAPPTALPARLAHASALPSPPPTLPEPWPARSDSPASHHPIPPTPEPVPVHEPERPAEPAPVPDPTSPVAPVEAEAPTAAAPDLEAETPALPIAPADETDLSESAPSPTPVEVAETPAPSPPAEPIAPPPPVRPPAPEPVARPASAAEPPRPAAAPCEPPPSPAEVLRRAIRGQSGRMPRS